MPLRAPKDPSEQWTAGEEAREEAAAQYQCGEQTRRCLHARQLRSPRHTREGTAKVRREERISWHVDDDRALPQQPDEPRARNSVAAARLAEATGQRP